MVATTLRASETSGRLFESAMQAIREYILSAGLKADDPLPPEGRLAQELGISRTSTREALKALESLGVVRVRTGAGVFVRSFSFDPILDNLAYGILFDRSSIRDLLRVRLQLEAGFVAQTAASASPDQLRVLRSIVDRMGERAIRGEDFAEEDRFFHRALYERIDNPLLLRLLDVFWVVARRLRDEESLNGQAERPDRVSTWEDHRRVVEALEAHDAAAARSAILTHFVNIETRIRGLPLRT